MTDHPANLALRFLLELAALASLAFWGWTTNVGLSRVAWAVGSPSSPPLCGECSGCPATPVTPR